ncbi:AAA family ATPase [Paraneptunicella aestuarii]|uniref:AAA family ATPase n=1 Tax=Paraneptunicella aestuarii TaxID=2831148 RepID=UPI001E5FE45B|nr:AAA family ATPase [Paraneptunicella aestuarii]UAA37736.1 AAA family ATPase [Paraneptunicella aestuarii]
MEIKKISLLNIGGFKNLDISLAPMAEYPGNVTVFIGNNGSGKTSLLRSISTALSWFISRVKSEKGNGSPILDIAINNDSNEAGIAITLMDKYGNTQARSLVNVPLQAGVPEGELIEDQFVTNWFIARTKSGKYGTVATELTDLSQLAAAYRHQYTQDENVSLPLLAFYSVERVVIEVPIKIKGKHSFQQIDGYDNSLSQGVDFRRFFEWFREREDSENESSINDEAIEAIGKALGINTGGELWDKLAELKASSKDRQLTAVRTAISNFMPGFSDLKVRRKPRLHMSIEKNGKRLNVAQMSQGEKSLLALVGDIARRLAMMNPGLKNPLLGDGIVLIDEVDMHLHPTWQRKIIQRLTDTFPNIQFILSTHSPLVISDVKDVLVYSLEDHEAKPLPSFYGKDANEVLLEAMDTSIRNEKVDELLNDLLDAIQDSDFDRARALLTVLEADLPNDNTEISKARILMRKQELRSEKNRQRD